MHTIIRHMAAAMGALLVGYASIFLTGWAMVEFDHRPPSGLLGWWSFLVFLACAAGAYAGVLKLSRMPSRNRTRNGRSGTRQED